MQGGSAEEVSVRDFLKVARPAWRPKDLRAVSEKLSRVGIATTPQLVEAIRAKGFHNLNQLLRESGEKAFTADTLRALREYAKEICLPPKSVEPATPSEPDVPATPCSTMPPLSPASSEAHPQHDDVFATPAEEAEAHGIFGMAAEEAHSIFSTPTEEASWEEQTQEPREAERSGEAASTVANAREKAAPAGEPAEEKPGDAPVQEVPHAEAVPAEESRAAEGPSEAASTVATAREKAAPAGEPAEEKPGDAAAQEVPHAEAVPAEESRAAERPGEVASAVARREKAATADAAAAEEKSGDAPAQEVPQAEAVLAEESEAAERPGEAASAVARREKAAPADGAATAAMAAAQLSESTSTFEAKSAAVFDQRLVDAQLWAMLEELGETSAMDNAIRDASRRAMPLAEVKEPTGPTGKDGEAEDYGSLSKFFPQPREALIAQCREKGLPVHDGMKTGVIALMLKMEARERAAERIYAAAGDD